MLPVSFDEDAPYVILADTRHGFRLILLPSTLPPGDGLIEPLWSFRCGDARSMNAVARWCNVRRAEWPAWAAIAEQDGAPALAARLSELIAQGPIGEPQVTLFQKGADPRVLGLGEMLVSSRGVQEEILYRHGFSTSGKRNRFFDWLRRNATNGSTDTLIDLAVREGTGAVAKVLEAIAAGEAPDLAVRIAA